MEETSNFPLGGRAMMAPNESGLSPAADLISQDLRNFPLTDQADQHEVRDEVTVQQAVQMVEEVDSAEGNIDMNDGNVMKYLRNDNEESWVCQFCRHPFGWEVQPQTFRHHLTRICESVPEDVREAAAWFFEAECSRYGASRTVSTSAGSNPVAQAEKEAAECSRSINWEPTRIPDASENTNSNFEAETEVSSVQRNNKRQRSIPGESEQGHNLKNYHLQDYLQSLVTSLEDLQTLKKVLIRRMKVLFQRIGDNQGYRMQISEKVDLWMRRVEKKISGGDQLKTEGDSLCLAGNCSMHYFSTSIFGGQVEKCVKELNCLKIEGERFIDEDLVVDAPAELDRGAKMPCDSVGLEAKLDEVLTFLSEKNVGIVAVYGQGGVGKTTLLKEINNHYVSRSENFLVVWIDVPKDVNLEAIQQAIGEKIGLPDELKFSNIAEKASYIFQALQQKKIILLLDDIRKAINLSKIGIPPSDSLNDSKVVFTTRPEHECRKMEPQPGRSTCIKTLGDEQAWELFVKRVGEDIINSHPQILQLARRVAKKCGGLPLALSIIGKAMCCEREPKVWEHIVKIFEKPSLQHSKSHREAHGNSMTELFSILRYSYDSLPNEIYKSCFLHCALFPEAVRIDKSVIIECWTFGDFSIDCDEDDLDLYYEAYRILNVLTSSCLLEDEKDWVKMHDVVRSMALWIAKEDTLVMSGMELKEAPSVRMWKQMKRVSLMDNDIKELTQVPACPDLLTLFLNVNEQLNEICSGFFESMGMLIALDLSDTSVKELPGSISRLVSLKYLNLSRTKITELPVALIKLKALMYLDVGGVVNLGLRRKSQIFRHLSSLQYLGIMCDYYYYYEEEGGISKVGGDDEILLEELQVLENLKVLEISLRSFSGLMKLFNNRRLLKRTRLLTLFQFTSLESIDISFVAQSKHLDEFLIVGCDFKELKNSQESTDVILKSSTSSVLTQMISFKSITRFTVGGCNYLEDITCVVSMPNLRLLHVSYCEKLREIISREKIGEVPPVGKGGEVYPIFTSLAILELKDLPVLKSIYPSNTLSLRFLYVLRVENCPQLKELPLDRNSSVLGGCSQIELRAKQKWWYAVEWEDDAAKAALLPRFNLNYLS